MRSFPNLEERALLVHALRKAAEQFEDSAVALERLLAQALAAQFRAMPVMRARWRNEWQFTFNGEPVFHWSTPFGALKPVRE